MLKSALHLTLLAGLIGCGLETGPGPGKKDSGVTSGSGAGGKGGSSGGTSGNAGTDGGSGATSSGHSGGGAGGDGGGVSGAGTGGSSGVGGDTGGSSGSGTGGDAGNAGTPSIGCTADDACPIEHPQCNGGGECGPCTSGAACEAREGLTHCAISGTHRGECVQCFNDQDCTDTPNTPHCFQLACMQCARNADCEDPLAPQCNNGTCGACTGEDACAGKAGGVHCVLDVGATDAGQCAACTENAHCSNPTPECTADHQCATCTSNDACTGRAGLTVCDLSSDATFSGQCVQCTGTQYAGCEQAGMPFVCASKTRTCAGTTLEHSADACQPCVSDAQCQTGKLCVMQTFNNPFDAPDVGTVDVGYFCAWREDAVTSSDCTTKRPFVKTEDSSSSIDGTVTNVCLLATTTCPAYTDFRNRDCEGSPGVADDSLCGLAAPDAHDGYCMPFGGTTFRCTTACLGDDDCKVGSSCNLSTEPDTCSLNP